MNDVFITKNQAWNKCLNLLLDPKVSEITTNGPGQFFIKRAGKRIKIDGLRMSEKEYYDGIEEGLVPFVKSQNTFSRNSFIFEGRLEYKVGEIDVRGRCHIVLPPATDYPQVTIAKKTTSLLSLEKIAAAGSMSDEMRQFLEMAVKGNASIVFSGSTGAGKALTLDTKIPTPSGWTTMGDVKVGDQVFDRFGNAVNVTHKFPQPIRPVYEVEFSTGEKVYCDAEHNWLVSTGKTRRSAFNYNYNLKGKEWRKKLSEEQIKVLKKIKDESSDNSTIQPNKIARLINQDFWNNQKTREALLEKVKIEDNNQFNTKELTDWLINEYAEMPYHHSQQSIYPDPYIVLTTKEMWSNGKFNDLKTFEKEYIVPIVEEAVIWKKTSTTSLDPDELPIHPYLFGLWLGDGDSHTGRLTASEEDKIAYEKIFKEIGIDASLKKIGNSGFCWRIQYEDFFSKLRELKVLKEKTDKVSKKDIPEIYLQSSIESRKFLLAGLIDSDGNSTKNAWEFTNGNKKLIEKTSQLANSLGYKSKLNKERDAKTTVWADGIERTSKPYYRLYISTQEEIAGLPRKNQAKRDYMINVKKIRSEYSTRYIKSISIAENRYEEMACITVDGKDSTYLITESFIPTHNTTMLEAMTKFIPDETRIGVAEDSPELILSQPNVTYLHSTPWSPGMNPNDVATLDWVVSQFMRNRIDRLLVGEVRGKEFGGFLTANNSGIEGGMITMHAETPTSCLRKMTSFTTEAKPGVPVRAINMDIATAVKIIVQLIILPGGKHRISHIEEITPTLSNSEDAQISTQPLYLYDRVSDSFYKAGNMSDSLREYFTTREQDVERFLKSEIGRRVKASSSSDSGGAQSDIPRREIPVYQQESEQEQRGLGRRLPTMNNPFNNGGKRTI